MPRREREPGGGDGVDRAGTNPPLLRATDEHRMNRDPFARDQRADPFRSVELVRSETGRID